MDFFSGDLDRVFTVLYEMGRIEPLLKKDWTRLYRSNLSRWSEISGAIKHLNQMSNLKDMRGFIETLPSEIIDALVVEVARELASYHENKTNLH